MSEPTGPAISDEGDKPPYLLYLLCACALVASVLMLFSSNTLWMKIAVLFALWAAFLGALATTRLRKQVSSHREHMRDAEALHQAALEREVASHREQERRLEQNYYQALHHQEQSVLEEIRAQLESLRENLEAMMGQDLEERQALRAEAQRIVELEDSVARRAAGHTVPVAEPLVEPEGNTAQAQAQPEPEPLPEDSGDPYAYLSTWGAAVDAHATTHSDDAADSTGVTYIGTDTEKSDYFVFDTAAFGPEAHSKHSKESDEPAMPEAPTEMTVKARKTASAQPQQRFSWAGTPADTAQPHGHHEKPERVADPATGSFAAFRPSAYSTPEGPAGTFNAGNYETGTDAEWERHRPVENTAGRRRADQAKDSTVTVASLLENLKKNSGPQQ